MSDLQTPVANLADWVMAEVEAEQAQTEAPVVYPDNYVTLKSGVVLEITGITPETYTSIQRRFESSEPRPPVVEIKGKGRREENPSDPDYIRAHNAWELQKSLGLLQAIYSFGTRVVVVPEGLIGPDSEEWAEEWRLSEMGVTNSAKELFVGWLKHKATHFNKEEFAQERVAIFNAAARMMGVSEADIAEAAKRPSRLPPR